MRRLYDKTMQMAQHKHAAWWLAAVSFIESSFFPIPPDVMLVPMVLADRKKAWFYAGLCTVTSVVGGCYGYAIGFFLYETVGAWIVSAYHLEREFELVERSRWLEDTALPPGLDFSAVSGLTREAVEKLARVQPATLGQAGRISGITPAAVTCLEIHLRKLGLLLMPKQD